MFLLKDIILWCDEKWRIRGDDSKGGERIKGFIWCSSELKRWCNNGRDGCFRKI
jgi:hypothetical protein